MSRLEKKFSALAAENRAGLIAYVMGGDPNLETSLDIVKGLPEAGADIIEIGFPFTDPMADGPVIQEAALRSLAAGTTLAKTLGLVKAFRDGDDETPVVLMGYYNPIYAYGREAFLKDAHAAGVDGLIVVDLPPEEDDELAAPAGAAGLDFIRLATPTTDAARLPQVVKNASGFIYYVSVAGVTGAAAGEAGTIAGAVSGLKAAGRLPVAVGFGVKTPEKAAEIARLADGVVVGSALVARIAENLDGDRSTGAECVNAVLKFARELGEAVRVARTDVSRV